MSIFRERKICGDAQRRTARAALPCAMVAAGILVSGSCGMGISTRAATLFAAQANSPAEVTTSTIQYDSSGTNIDAYLAKPNGGGKHAAIIVVHDNQGLTDQIRDVARQFAAEGFVALAPDLASRLGGSRTPAQEAQAIGQLSPNRTVQDLRAGIAYLQMDADVDATKISTAGFGWGGWRSFMLAASVPDLYRAVVYSGSTPSQGIENAHAAVLANYAQYDFRVTGNALWTEKTMREAGKSFTYYVYPKVGHAFYTDGGPQYDAEAAKQAWTRTLDFLKK